MRARRSTARRRAPRNASPNWQQRLLQLDDDIARERQLASDSETSLERLTGEAAALRRDLEAGESKRSDADDRVAQADAVLAGSEKNFGEMTGALADLTARRKTLKRAAREQTDRLTRLERDIADVVAEFAQDRGRQRGLPRSCGAAA